MKRGMLTSYVAGLTDMEHGERYPTIFRYFVPEVITAFILYSLPFWLDAAFISQLKSTATYATLGTTNNLLHFIIKIADAFGVATVVLSGQLNGMHAYQQAGRAARDAFWVTCIVGLIIASALYAGAWWIYRWYGVPDEMIDQGVPFLRIRALGLLFTFVYFALVGFLRGIKNTRAPMYIFVTGITIFVILDYALIFGVAGLPALGLQGSAVASLVQYVCMLGLAIGYIQFNPDIKPYAIEFFAPIKDGAYAKRLLMLSWPMVLDKAILAAAYIWLCKMIWPMGTKAVATFCVIKDMEKFAFLPAIACAQIITFLVSNDMAQKNWLNIKTNIKKIMLIASSGVATILLLFSVWPRPIIQIFDRNGEFIDMAAHVFPLLSVLVLFDMVQLVLAGALRGAGNVKTVMYVRLAICLGYFVPLSYILSALPIQDQTLKFLLVYGSFYLGNALMSIMYINRFRSDAWQHVA